MLPSVGIISSSQQSQLPTARAAIAGVVPVGFEQTAPAIAVAAVVAVGSGSLGQQEEERVIKEQRQQQQQQSSKVPNWD